MHAMPLDVVPLWLFFILAALFCVAAVEAGYRLGAGRRARGVDEKEEPVAAMVASLLGLVAFMLAFTFSLAAARFDARRQAVLEEANAIGTTYLRTRLLPEPQRTECANLLREYTEVRLNGVADRKITELISASEKLHEELWTRAVAAARIDRSPITALFLQSLNETIDVHSVRLFVGLQSRIPMSNWLALFCITLLGMVSIGYQSGLAAARRSPLMGVLVVAFAGVLLLIVDLDRGQEGFLQVSQQSIIDLLRTMAPAKLE